jgi:acetylornithine deacetylase/succinyl-diaminopimelate desuccinylase-like protein
VSFRLVAGQDPQKIRAAFRQYVTDRLPPDAKVEFREHGGSPAVHLAIDGEAMGKARAALQTEWGKAPALVGSGGSIPVVGQFKSILGMDSLMIGFGLDDDRIHSPNEKYEVSSYHGGIRSWVRILDALAQ